MDNEEIRELLKELKETSDESSSVKSRIVKIHFDTRKEAEARERERQKAREEEEKRRLLEEEEEKEKQEALAREAEKKAEEIVTEAKAEASAAFSPDLGKDIGRLEEEEPQEEEKTPPEDELKLNWDPVKMPGVRRYLGRKFARSAGPEEQDSDEASSDEKKTAEDEEEPAEEQDEESGSIPQRLFGRMKAGVGSFMQKLARQDAEEEAEEKGIAPVRDGGAAEPKDDEEETDDDEFDDDTSFLDSDLSDTEDETVSSGSPEDDEERPVGEFGVPASPGVEMREITSPEPEKAEEVPEKKADPDEEWKKRMEEPPRFNLRHVKIPDMPVKKWNFPLRGRKKEEKISPEEGEAPERVPEADQYPETEKVSRVQETEAAPVRPAEAQDESSPMRPAGTLDDSETARHAESPEAAEKPSEAAEKSSEAAEKPSEAAEKPSETGNMASGEVRDPSFYRDDFESDAADFRSPAGERQAEGSKGFSLRLKKPDTSLSELLNKVVRRRKTSSVEEMQAKQQKEQKTLEQELAHMRQDFERQQEEPAAEDDGGEGKESGPQSIEVVNLNENANNKQVEVISLDKGSTGPLPDLSGQNGGRKESEASSDGGPVFGKVIGDRKKRMTLIFLAAGIVLAIFLIFWAVRTGIGGSESSTGSGVTADEGLNVRIRRQPMEYTKSGEVTLTIRVPKTIQSITVDDQAVKFEGDKKTEITVPVSKSSLKLMVVSTDKVRSATIKLMYVDSQPPVISVKNSGGKVTLSARDDGSGVEGIYYGTCGDFSDVPLYQKYTGPFEEDEDAVYSWYAVDNAGNMTVPVSGSFTEASSIAFEKESYQVYPNSDITLKVDASPAGAYVNDLAYSSSDESVVKIEHGNVLVPVSKGSAVVTASADGLESATADVVVSDARQVTISAVGDCTLGTDPALAPENSFPAYQAVYGNEYFMKNVKGILSQDDATIANFEGTLTTSEERANKKFTFKGDASCTEILKDGSIDVVTLANNHTMDYGEQGLADTKQNLEDAGIDWCSGEDIAYKDLNGIKCAFIGIYAVENGLDSMDMVESTVAEAKDQGAQIILVDFHWNSELVPDPNPDMVTLGHAAVDAGASLVVGSHSHLVSGIEKYNGRYIVYGLSNFCFGGNLYPNDYDSMIFRQTFTVDGEGIKDDDEISIIPVRISSQDGANNYQPTPVSGDAAARIMQKIDERSAQFGSEWDEYMIDGTNASQD